MAAPSAASSRPTPGGRFLTEGHSTVVVFSRKPSIGLWIKQPKPPGVDGGEKIKITSMHNLLYHTAAPQALIMITDGTFTASYDPQALADIITTLINAPGTITIFFPDNSTFAAYGYLQKFEPNQIQQGQQPEGQATVCITNWDVSNWVEAGPVITQVAGT